MTQSILSDIPINMTTTTKEDHYERAKFVYQQLDDTCKKLEHQQNRIIMALHNTREQRQIALDEFMKFEMERSNKFN